ncbi:MAG TPA: NADH-quinone oxidoreductase subunit N [Verrucomicrobiae bacterium]|jgi:NADH-quinone oxidoreductase subunit N|nr:NADH-quinone oxidoreductase subunit N [Verrucomicrobiae bacterium]
MNFLELLQLAVPETVVVLTALIVLAVDVVTMRELETRFRFLVSGMIACVGCFGAIAWMLISHTHANAFGGMLVVDPMTQFVKIALLALTIFTILLSMDSDFTDHVGEYLALILLAAVGMMFLVSAEDILMIFIALELTSLSLYILTAFNKRDIKSAEASLKYFLFGGMSAAFTLFGLSLIYGLSGTTNLPEIAAALAGKGLDPLLAVAIVMVVIGFGFKVAAVPFHLWAPDAYQGAPTPSAAFIASGSKVASFFIFAKVMAIGFAGKEIEGSGAWHGYVPGWVPVVAIVAALSMILGNLVAIVQSSVRRLIAYSAIAHAGYMLLAIMSHNEQGLKALIYYAVTYGLTTIGVFGVVAVVERGTGGEKLSDFAGLSRRAPLVSFCMLIFMLSLAGIPPLAGFFGKFFVFTAAINSDAPNLGLLWLVILAVAMSAVSLFYYLQVLKQIYVSDPAAPADPLKPSILTQIVLAVLAGLVILFGCFPNLLIGRI